MAIAFNAGVSSNLYVNQAVVSAYPFSMACWFNADDTDHGYSLMWVGDKDVTNYFCALMARGRVGDDSVSALTHQYGATYEFVDTSSGFSANTWHHACGVWTNNQSRAAFIDGGSKGTGTVVSGAMANHDKTAIGASLDSSADAYFDGGIAEAAIWSIALSDAEVAQLATGLSPLAIRRESLLAYWPLIDAGYLLDMIGGNTLTSHNVGDHVHPRIIRPSFDKGIRGGSTAPPPSTHYMTGNKLW